MHEFHLLTQVVKTVEDRLQGEPKAKPVLVRLKIQASSHLLAQDLSTLHAAFVLASHCKTGVTATDSDSLCAMCGGPVLTGQSESEVMVHELVVEE
jgi:Zn finger protein HypA/HybF involved in hydrogenase expression